jgi:hypothetical protein
MAAFSSSSMFDEVALHSPSINTLKPLYVCQEHLSAAWQALLSAISQRAAAGWVHPHENCAYDDCECSPDSGHAGQGKGVRERAACDPGMAQLPHRLPLCLAQLHPVSRHIVGLGHCITTGAVSFTLLPHCKSRTLLHIPSRAATRKRTSRGRVEKELLHLAQIAL